MRERDWPVANASRNEIPLPVPGPRRLPTGDVEWQVWAPGTGQVELVVWRDGHPHPVGMQAHHGFHRAVLADVPEGTRYLYRLPHGEFPDPASRWQPDGVHRPSAVYSPGQFAWSNQDWRGIARADLVIYELHVGTFTPEGTFAAIIPRITQLLELGITAIELMPIAQFPGSRNWGYDGVHWYAVQNSYGGPQGLLELVNAAHRAGLAVILDVVYNHFGPEGNYAAQFGPYFTSAYRTPWGAAVNYDGPDSDPVRQFVIDNARMWIAEFHLDGLRLDAVHAIYDLSAHHLLAEIQAEVRQIAQAQERVVHVIAESDQNNPRLIDPTDRYGFGLDAIWVDDFHHSVRALIPGHRQGYFQAYGQPEDLAKAYEDIFVYDGRFSSFRRRRHGAPVQDRDRTRFVVYVDNHDQIGNRALGDRTTTYLSPAAQRLCAGLLFLSPCIPQLFMGEEYGEERPFPFFCSFGDADLIESVRRGRREEFAGIGFQWGADLPDPQSEQTFQSAVLSWKWDHDARFAQRRTLYRAMADCRRCWPPLRDRQTTRARVVRDGTTDGAILVIERGSAPALIAVANLTEVAVTDWSLSLGERVCLLSTEERRFGGDRDQASNALELQPYELKLFGLREWIS